MAREGFFQKDDLTSLYLEMIRRIKSCSMALFATGYASSYEMESSSATIRAKYSMKLVVEEAQCG